MPIQGEGVGLYAVDGLCHTVADTFAHLLFRVRTTRPTRATLDCFLPFPTATSLLLVLVRF